MISSPVRRAVVSGGLLCVAVFLAGCGSGDSEGSSGGDSTSGPSAESATPAPTTPTTPTPTSSPQTPAPPTPAPTPRVPVWLGSLGMCRWMDNKTAIEQRASCDDATQHMVFASIVLFEESLALDGVETCNKAVQGFLESVCKSDHEGGNATRLIETETVGECLIKQWDVNQTSYQVLTKKVICDTVAQKQNHSYNTTTFGTAPYGDNVGCAKAVASWKTGVEENHKGSCSASTGTSPESFSAVTDGVGVSAEEKGSGQQTTDDNSANKAFFLGVAGLVLGTSAFACHFLIKKRSQARDMSSSNSVEMGLSSAAAA